MQISRHSDYALRLLLIVGAEPERSHRISDIASALGVSENHLAKVAQSLGRAGFVQGQRGRGGGLRLALPANRIRVGDVLRATSTEVPLVECLKPATSTCVLSGACHLTAAFDAAHQAFLATLDRVTLADSLTPPAQERLSTLRVAR